MQELEKILEEINRRIDEYVDHDYVRGSGDVVKGLSIAKSIVRKHMNDGWISAEERMPTQEECEDNWFWIAYGNSFGNSPRIAKCEWVFADDEDGNDDSGPEFYIDQFPFPYKPSINLIKAWKIIDIPASYHPERSEE